MIIYLAGNFTIANNVDREKEFKETLGEDYHRLCTFYHPKSMNIVIKGEDIPRKKKVKKNAKKRIIKRTKRSKARRIRKRNS